MNWSAEYTGRSTANPKDVFAVLADPATWSQWNDGVLRVDTTEPFVTGASAVMVLPDGTALPFTLAWMDPDRGFEDVTEVAGTGVTVRVRHLLAALPDGGTLITYACVADGEEQAAREVGTAVSADFPQVIAALAARAEGRR